MPLNKAIIEENTAIAKYIFAGVQSLAKFFIILYNTIIFFFFGHKFNTSINNKYIFK
jgi:hypothetical protein